MFTFQGLPLTPTVYKWCTFGSICTLSELKTCMGQFIPQNPGVPGIHFENHCSYFTTNVQLSPQWIHVQIYHSISVQKYYMGFHIHAAFISFKYGTSITVTQAVSVSNIYSSISISICRMCPCFNINPISLSVYRCLPGFSQTQADFRG